MLYEVITKLIDMIAALEPTFGGINLEDIKAPECFYIERKLRERMNIPVFHDDQHGTAILGLGNLGPLASKPVMEGKALLFKRFAGIDAIDIEVTHTDNEDFRITSYNVCYTKLLRCR